jgi:hypothetical protein
LGNPAPAIAATGQGRGPRLGKAAIIDISGNYTADHDRLDRRWFIPAPSPLSYFAAEVFREPFFRGGKPAQIMNRHRFEASRIEGAHWTGRR